MGIATGVSRSGFGIIYECKEDYKKKPKKAKSIIPHFTPKEDTAWERVLKGFLKIIHFFT